MKVCGYIRRSQEDSDSMSIENQERAIKEFCEKENHELITIYNEGFFSGADVQRPQFNKMILEISNYGAVVVREQSRLARHAPLIIGKIHDIYALGGKIFTTYGKELDPGLETGVRALVDEQVIKDGQRHQREMMMRKIKDKLPFGTPPTGYKKHHKKENGRTIKTWIVDKKKANLIKLLFKLYAIDDESIRDIVLEYPELGTDRGVRKMLNNKAYIGIFAWTMRNKNTKGEVVKEEKGEYKAKITPLVSEDLFNKAQEKLARNRNYLKNKWLK